MSRDISNEIFYIRFDPKLGEFVLLSGEKPILTPGGHPVTHRDRRFLERLRAELDGLPTLDPTRLGRYSIYSTYRDNFAEGGKQFQVSEVRALLLGDRLLRSCAGPEITGQFANWTPLLRWLESIGCEHPGFPQSRDGERMEQWIADAGPAYAARIEELLRRLRLDLSTLNPAQLTVVVNVTVVYGSICLGYLLATRNCTELEFAMAILAADCLIPKTFDVSQDEYRQHLQEILFDANSLVDFIRFFVNPGDLAREQIKRQLPNYAFLPEAAQWALVESLDRLEGREDGDFSGYVVLLTKALELTLMENVFEAFRLRSGIRIEAEKDVNLIIKRDFSEIERFARYVLKEPHYLELGAMMVTLEKYGGTTARKNQLLHAFFEYLKANHSPALISKEFVVRSKRLSELRNRAAHRELMSKRATEKVRDEVFSLLAMLG